MIKVEVVRDQVTDRIVHRAGTCICKALVDMLPPTWDDSYECPACGALYNSAGQRLRPRNQWEEPLEDP